MNRYFYKSVLVTGMLCIMVIFSRSVSEARISREAGLPQTKADPAFLKEPSLWADSVLDTLSLEEKIGQLIMVAAYSNNNIKNEAELARLIRDQKIGGLVFFQGTPYRQAELTNYYQSISRVPLLIGMDAENGLAMRLDSTIRYPSQMMLGAIDDDRLIFDMGRQIAEQMKRLGVHINFAPVVDVNNNPCNPVINRRSFGEDLQTVSRKSLFYMIGLENAGIISVAKHFPGHGDTETDSHKDLPVINQSKERLDSLELYPFRELIFNGLSGIMTAHLSVPALDPRESMPSSLSEVIVDTLLRQKMGFKGLVFTDALNMRAVTRFYKPVDAAEKALEAGNDILLMPDDISDVIKEISRRVKSGKISEAVINEKCRKVLAAKAWAGLSRYHPVAVDNITGDLNKPEYALLQQKLTSKALTVLRNRKDLLPLMRLDTLKTALVVFSPENDTVFRDMVKLYTSVTCFHIRGDATDDTDSLYRELDKFNLIIASIHGNSVSPLYNYGINDEIMKIADSIFTRGNVVLDLFTSPYMISSFKHIDMLSSLIISYENSPIVQSLSAQAIFGATGLSGTLPVSCENWHAVKAGLKIKPNGRLGFSIPIDAGMNQDTLDKIDNIIAKAMEFQAIPGCEILVARKGKVIFNKTYGYQDYSRSRHVQATDLYDLASVTKVAATTQAIMHLVDEGCVGINQKLSAYLPYLEKTNKKDLYIADILLHQSGLQPFMQFFFATEEPVFRNNALIASGLSETNPIKIGAGQYLNRYTQYKTNIISSNPSPEFPLQVADNIYICKSWPDTMFNGIAASSLRDKKEYVYSDLGFILFKQMVDSITRLPYEKLMDSLFYRRLGASSLCFNPLNRFNRNDIAPTEYDLLFRRQLVRGFVHDPRAAMFGGVAGHAGLFGNAVDLAKLCQMLLNKGEYAGERYISEKTVEMFTLERHGIKGSRRGLGFDKPETDHTKPSPACLSASPESFGHTGFTGTMIWVDPEYDLVYVFLSNRVYPDALNNRLIEMNIRTDVQQVLYNAITEK